MSHYHYTKHFTMSNKEKEVVISGIGGKFPECNNLNEFKEKLFSKTTLLKPDPDRGCNENTLYTGKIPEWNKFDFSFFGVHPRLARNADPMMGLMLERTFEAIVDAGINPYTLKGSNIGVISATSISEAEIMNMTLGTMVEGLGMVGHSRTMMANRISYCFNFTGPSYSCDNSWLSSLQALQIAASLVSNSVVDAAIVTTCNLIRGNISSIDEEYKLMNFLSPDGPCCPFDAQAHGFSRSEGNISFFLQRAQEAKRKYCSVIKIDNSYLGSRPCGFLGSPLIETFLQDFYKDCSVDPGSVAYVEASGCCVQDIDAAELNGFASVYHHDEFSPLLVGSLSGNIGNAECTGGLMFVAKAVIALEGGVLPPTINYNTPNPKVPALVSGTIKPVTESTELPGDIIAVNALNCYGSVSHMLLQRHRKVKAALEELSTHILPRLVILQARNEEAAMAIAEQVCSMPVDPEYISLVNDVFKTQVPAYLCRAFAVVPSVNDKPTYDAQVLDSTKRPVWWVFSGMGSQWTRMGQDLLQIPVFAAAIEECDQALRPRGLDLLHILTTDDPTIFDNILHCFLGIAAIQIGLVDILRVVGVTPDGIVGHSVGELGCAYADGCLSAREMILAAYARGRASLEANVVPGMMAAIGLGYNSIKDRLPDSIDVACRNAADSCTISGPKEDILKYVEELKAQGVFARAVNAGGIAYHSRYIKTIGPKLLAYLKETIPEPKPRSARWISSSVPQAEWNSRDAILCSPEYHTNNLLNPVLFDEACQHIPKAAVVIEIAPRGLLQAILRRSLSADCINLSLTSFQTDSNVRYLIKGLGTLYLNNVNIDGNALYPPVEYPVSRGTPSLAPLATWDHTVDNYERFSSLFSPNKSNRTFINSISIDTSSTQYQKWKKHCMFGFCCVPVPELLKYAWDMMFYSKQLEMDQHQVVFESVTVKDNIILDGSEINILMSISPISLKLEVDLESPDVPSKAILSGKLLVTHVKCLSTPELQEELADMEEVTDVDVYSSLTQYGYQLGEEFQTIKQLLVGKYECIATVQWTGDVVAFLNSMINIVVFVEVERQDVLLRPISIKKLTVDVSLLTSLEKGTEVQVHYDMRCGRVVCRAAELLGLTLSAVDQHQAPAHNWRESKLLPYLDNKLSLEQFLTASVQVAAESGLATWTEKTVQLTTLAVRDQVGKPSLYVSLLREAFKFQKNISGNLLEVELDEVKELLNKLEVQGVLVAGDYHTLNPLINSLPLQHDVFCLTYLNHNGPLRPDGCMHPILLYQSDTGRLALLKRVQSTTMRQVFEMTGCDWLERLRQLMSKDAGEHPVLVYSHTLTPRHVLPVLAKEHYASRLKTFFILDKSAPKFSLTSPLYSGQVASGLAVNVLSKGVWSSLRSFIYDVPPQTANLDFFINSKQNIDLKCVGLNTTSFTVYEDPSIDKSQVEIKFLDYSGTLSGQNVMGFAEVDSTSGSIVTDSILQWTVPEYWSLEEAASVPVIYLMAYYCIQLKARVLKGEGVLVHAGLSPIGQAIISVALQSGANVYVSVETEDDRIHLMKIFPSLKASQVVSQDLHSDIGLAIKTLTKGEGVEVIINCLSDGGLQSSVKVMGMDCRFLHLGQIRIEDDQSIGMSSFFNRTSFHGVSLNNIANCSDERKAELQEAVERGIKFGVVKPFKSHLFPFHQRAEAIFHCKMSIEEKVVLNMHQLNNLYTRNGSTFYDPHHLVIIAGTKGELWVDVAEWLARHGARRLVVLSDADEEEALGTSLRRVNRLIDVTHCTLAFTPSSRLDTHEDAVDFFKDMLRMGTIPAIFCICMDDNGSKMKSLDSACRELVPDLPQFVTLLDSGWVVSEERAASGLPVCALRSDSTLHSLTHVLPYLSAIMAEGHTVSRFINIAESAAGVTTSENQVYHYQSFLPTTLEELQVLDEGDLRFQEVTTRSPRLCHVRHTLLPVFLVSGLGVQNIRPLTQQLAHPAFVTTLPTDSSHSVKEFAELLLQEVMKIQRMGPYNVLGVSWGGAVALELSGLLESRGQHVELMLLEGAPASLCGRIQALCDSYQSDLPSSLLACVFHLTPTMAKELRQKRDWDEMLSCCLRVLPEEERGAVYKGVSALLAQLTALQHYQPSCQRSCSNLTLLTAKPLSQSDASSLLQLCKLSPKIIVTRSDSYKHLVSDPSTASYINENVAVDTTM